MWERLNGGRKKKNVKFPRLLTDFSAFFSLRTKLFIMSLALTFTIFLFSFFCSCQVLSKKEKATEASNEKPLYRIMFWNVENLFDTRDDSLTDDSEFTPEGIRRWGYTRYKQKVNNIYKVLAASGDPYPPEIIGLCEVENRSVLLDITFNSPFLRHGYKIVHRDSPDRRGIDVAVLYDPARISILNTSFISPYMTESGPAETREIVYIEALSHHKDTLHIFFNHWPSKYGGAGYTEPMRQKTATTLKNHIDSLQSVRPDANIIIGGDFNDPPDAIGLRQVLGAECASNAVPEKDKIYNISCEARPGTYKYQGIWSVLDQFMVSGNMLMPGEKKDFQPIRFEIFSPSFLLVNDETFSGVKPYRTWNGMKYSGGYSDHLPVVVSIYGKRR